MSKQSEAKERQQYVPKCVPKCVPQTCGNCAHIKFVVGLPKWMAERNIATGGSRYTVEQHGKEQDIRCGVGGFIVKKMGTCAEWGGRP